MHNLYYKLKRRQPWDKQLHDRLNNSAPSVIWLDDEELSRGSLGLLVMWACYFLFMLQPEIKASNEDKVSQEAHVKMISDELNKMFKGGHFLVDLCIMGLDTVFLTNL